MFPSLVVETDQDVGRVTAGVGQAGHQPVGAGEDGSAGAGHRDTGLDDADLQGADHRQIGAVSEGGQDGGAAVAAQPAKHLGAGGADLAEEGVAVEALVPSHEHVGRQKVQQAPGALGELQPSKETVR
ncbi:hypothetical protein [Nonomuraea fuscirosea]|uniref:hypothetical protein n=1 Tax=Nonomuraea fuscirosea TaxID=1291556 RepID=UPI0011B2696C|nr:hypothetical protein [Nonomuraea fuscirosea]